MKVIPETRLRLSIIYNGGINNIYFEQKRTLPIGHFQVFCQRVLVKLQF
jgi:hypothetical protein